MHHIGTPTDKGLRVHRTASTIQVFGTSDLICKNKPKEILIKKRGTCVWGQLIQQLHHAFSLLGGPHLDGRPASNPAVLLLNFGGSAFGDDWCQLTKSFNR